MEEQQNMNNLLKILVLVSVAMAVVTAASLLHMNIWLCHQLEFQADVNWNGNEKCMITRTYKDISFQDHYSTFEECNAPIYTATGQP